MSMLDYLVRSPALRFVCVVLFGCLAPSTSYAIDDFRVDDIRLEGVQRSDPGVIFARLPFRVGEIIDSRVISQVVKDLYGTGYFADVQLRKDGNDLVVVVVERPAIASINFYGLKEFKEEQLKQALTQIGIKEGEILDPAKFDLSERELKNAYLGRARYGVEVSSTLTPLERNRVGLSFTVFEGAPAKIESIKIIGSEKISLNEIFDVMSLDETSFFSWYSKNDQYSKLKLEADLESLKSLYLDRGFLKFDVTNTQVSLSPDKETVHITISVNEGNQYKVTGVTIMGKTEVPAEELDALIDFTPGEIFSRAKLNRVTQGISDRLAAEGYIYAKVNAVPQLDEVLNSVQFTLFVDPGRRIYVRRINIEGNARTRDEVIRREMRQFEGSWYSLEKIKRSKKRLDLTGYFSSVQIDNEMISGASDQIDLNVKVVERQTGSFSVGVGYSSEDKALLSAGVTNDNIFGSGNSLSFNVSSGSVNEIYSLTYVDPYVTDGGISRSLSLFNRNTDYASLSGVSNYSENSSGVTVDYGLPLSETDKVFVGGGVEKNDLALGSDASIEYTNFVALNGSSNTTIPINIGWARDRRDSAVLTSEGTYQKVRGSVATPAGDLSYYTLDYRIKSYFPITNFTSFSMSGGLSYSDDYGSKELPFYKNFFLGGATTLRGYQASSLGPVNANNLAIGAKRRVLLGAEIFTPFPGIKDDKSIRLSSFFDAGGLSNGFDDVMSDLRYSTGVALNWYSPVGPMRIILAKPLNAKSTDKKQVFQFDLGSLF